MFYTMDKKTRLGRVYSIEEDTFTTSDGATVPKSVAINTVIPRDCVLHRHDLRPTDTFLAPGVCVGQTNHTLEIRLPTGAVLTTHSHKTVFTHVSVDMWGKRCFGLDEQSRFFLHVFGIDEPTIHTHFSKIRPIGWLYVPTTMAFFCWNDTQLCVIDIDSNRDIHLPQRNVRCAATSRDGGICVTGDTSGQVCVWFTSTWQCHHTLQIFRKTVEQCVISSSGHAAARSSSAVVIFDTTTGITAKRFKRHANALCYTGENLVLSTGVSIELYTNGELTMSFKYEADALYPSKTEGRVFSTYGDTITEMRLNNDSSCVRWAKECQEWIASPSLPFEYTWPAPRYMDVLAASAGEWMCQLTSFQFPKTWWRHSGLRDAIWDACLEHIPEDIESMSRRWSFLETHVHKVFLQKCVKYLEDRMSSFEWDEPSVAILEHIYRRMTIKSEIIKRWCWFHHGHPRIQRILMRLFEKDHDRSLIAIANADSVSPDAILCLTEKSIQHGLHGGYAPVFIRWLESYHKEYTIVPGPTLLRLYLAIYEHVFSHLGPENMDTPMPHTGSWCTLNPTPAHIGTYVREKASKVTGFIQKVHIQQNGTRTIHWRPRNRVRIQDTISKPNEMEYWKWSHISPRTLLECALYLLRDTTLCCKGSIKPWCWFRSKVGADLSRGRRILVFGKPMAIKSSDYEQGVCSIRTSSNMNIKSTENATVEIQESAWSYLDTLRHRIMPLETKIVRLLNSVHRKNVIDIGFASDVLNCCRSKMLDIEHVWFPKHMIQAVMIQNGSFFAGFDDGSIVEYEHISVYSYTVPIRCFFGHEDSILQLHAVEEKMVSLSTNTMIIWCILSGMMLHYYESTFGIHSAVIDGHNAWLAEKDASATGCPTLTLWDTEFEKPMYTLELPNTHCTDVKCWLARCNGQNILTFGKRVLMWDTRQIEQVSVIDVVGDIMCICNTNTHIAGGTTEGTLFFFDVETELVEQWSASNKHALVSIAHMPNNGFVITGSSHGQISVWDGIKKNFGVCLFVADTEIVHLYSYRNFVLAMTDTAVHLLSIVPHKCMDTCLLLHNLMQWSHPWKTAVMRKTVKTIQPCIASCLLGTQQVGRALELAEICTEEYNDRALWCNEKLIDIFLEIPLAQARKIVKRIAGFKGHRIDCVICNDTESKDTVSYITHCQHRFHTKCLHKLIQKTPELHDEMQYEYALQVTLKCPTCRVEFQPGDVKLDHYLNKHLVH